MNKMSKRNADTKEYYKQLERGIHFLLELKDTYILEQRVDGRKDKNWYERVKFRWNHIEFFICCIKELPFEYFEYYDKYDKF